MLDLVPERLIRLDAESGDAVLVEPEGDLREIPQSIALSVRRRRQTSLIGRFNLGGSGSEALRRAGESLRGPAETLVCLPPGPLIEKSLTLPLAAERDLDRVIGYEMDRETPFAAEEVWWSTKVESRDRAHGRIQVRLSLIPRVAVAGVIDELARLGLNPSAIEAAAGGGAIRRIPLSSSSHFKRFGVNSRRILVAACIALVVADLATPFAVQSLALTRVEDRIASLRPDTDLAEALRRRLDGTSAAVDIIAAQRAQFGDPMVALAAVTRVLPDDTHLTDFAMRARQLTLVGESADAARLIGKMASDPAFKDPAFSAPVTRADGRPADRFSISAESRP